MKKIILSVSLLIFLTGLFAGVVSAKEIINEIIPSNTVGVYEAGEEVEFLLRHEKQSERQTVECIIYNVAGETRARRVFGIAANTDSTSFSAGILPVGWYRLKFYQKGSLISSQYCSAAVVMPEGTRNTDDSPFCADQAGAFASTDGLSPAGPWTTEQRIAYARAMRLAGVSYVRERALGANGTDVYSGIEEQTKILNDEKISVLNNMSYGSVYTEDLYNTFSRARNNAVHFSGKISAWEGNNEPDHSTLENTPDMEASIFKAAALGVLDSGSGAVKAASSLYNIYNTDFMEVMMQNGIMDYADCLNVHSHKAVYDDLAYLSFPTYIMEQARMAATVYGGGRPVWCTEAGIAIKTDENSNSIDREQKRQAKYTITSAVESIAEMGCERFFCFLFRHWEGSVGNYGLFSKNHMPYAGYSAFSNLTYYLGQGKLKGELRNLPSDVNGFLFDAGDYDVAVLYKRSSGTAWMQLDTAESVRVVDLLGASEDILYSPNNELVNLPVTDSPILVKFPKRARTTNYYKKEYPTYPEVSVTAVPDSKRVILRQTWSPVKISECEYRLEHGKEYTITLGIYNFTANKMRGTITPQLSEGLELVGEQSVSYSVLGNRSINRTFVVRVREDFTGEGTAYVSFEGTAGSGTLSPSVAKCYILPQDGGEGSDVIIEKFPEITLTGLKEKGIYKDNETLTVTAQIPEELSNVRVYVNYEETSDFTLTDNQLKLVLRKPEPGAYYILVSGEYRYGYICRGDLDFYVRDNRDYQATGTFYNLVKGLFYN